MLALSERVNQRLSGSDRGNARLITSERQTKIQHVWRLTEEVLSPGPDNVSILIFLLYVCHFNRAVTHPGIITVIFFTMIMALCLTKALC